MKYIRIVAATLAAALIVMAVISASATAANVSPDIYAAFGEGRETADVIILMESPDETAIKAQADKAADDYIQTLDVQDYSSSELTSLWLTKQKDTFLELMNVAYKETVLSIVKRLGLEDGNYSYNDGTGNTWMRAKITMDQALEIDGCDLIFNVYLIKNETPSYLTAEETFGWELYSTMKGDANNDFKVNIADAVKILQYIANGQKYPLTDQEKINADCDGIAGITGGDAIMVQKMDAGLV